MNVFDLYAKIVLDTDEYKKDLDDASEKTGKFSSALKGGLVTAAKAGAAAVTAAAGSVVALTKTALDSYGEYEQLVGGAQLMFGDAYDFVAEKAKKAYSTVQMSQNDYLRQMNGFATGLKTALGGNEKAAAELADKILTAEADVVAATGSSQEAVQNAFNGIMKSNYTMLDNLQLGITPTKEGFQEVIDKVNEWNAANGNATKYQIDNLADAQSALVDYITMQGMAGYASAEAADTIQGSVASMKAAWTNFVTGLADENANITELSEQLIESVVVVADNAIPVIETVLSNIAVAVKEYAPEMIEKFVGYAIEKLPEVIELGLQLILAIAKGLSENLPQLVTAVLDMMATIVQTVVDSIPDIVEVGKQIVQGLWEGIKSALGWIGAKVGGAVDGIKNVITGKKGFDVHSPSKWAKEVGEYVSIGLANGIEEKATDAQKAAEKMAKNIYSGLSDWAEKQTKYNALTLQDQLEMWRAIQNQFVSDSEEYAKAEEKVFDLKKQIQEEYYNKVEEITQNITELEDNYQKTLADRTQEIFDTYGLFDEIPMRQKKSGDELAQNLTNQIGLINEFYTGLEKLMERGVGDGLVDDIRDMGPSAISELNALLDMSDEKLSEYAALYEEKQRLANEIAAKELEDLRASTASQIQQNLQELQQLYDGEAPEVGLAFTDGLAEGIQNGMSTVINSAVSMAQAAVSAVRNTLGIHSPSRVFAGIGENMALGLGVGWEDEFSSIQKSIAGGLDFGMGHVSFAESGLGMSSAAMVNSMSGENQSGGVFTVNLVLPDMTKIASYAFDPLVEYARANGTPILNPA